MLNFVIYEDDKQLRELIGNIIKRFLYTAKDYYVIHAFDNTTPNMMETVKKLEGMKIYIVDADVPVISGIDFARMVRNNGDYTSLILVISLRRPESLVRKLKNILYLDIINKENEFIRNMLLCLSDAYRIAARHEVYTFSIFDELYRIPFDEINYIEKNIHDDSVTLFTKDDSYQNYVTIKRIADELKRDPRFFKSHRSSVINLYNVASYDRKNNRVIFKSGMTTDLIARNRKKLLVEKLEELDCVVK